MAIKLKNFLELYVPKAGDERKFVAKHVVKKTKDANKNDDKLFTGSNIKAIDREKEHGYNPGNDEKVYEEVEQIQEMDVRTAKELAAKFRNKGKLKHASIYDKVATALQRGDQTTAQGFMNELKGIDEATLSTGEMKKREDYVKGMKKNISSFTSKYGKDAKSVMYATATKMDKEEAELDENAVTDYYNKKRDMRDAEHKKQDPKTQSNYYAKNMVDTEKAAKKANERGIKKDARDFDWKVRNGVQRGKLPEEVEVDEARGHKMITTKLANIERMKNIEIPAAADRKKDKNNAKGAFKDMFGGDSKDLMSGLKIKEDTDGVLLDLYFKLDEENQEAMLQIIDDGGRDELLEFANTLEGKE